MFSSKSKKAIPMSSPISTEALLKRRPTLDLVLEKGDEPPKNKAGEFMRRSLIDPRKYYCGLEVDPDDYGPLPSFICDPEQGHQCDDCKRAQRFIEKTDTSQPVNAEGRTMNRGNHRRDLFYCGFKGCGPHKGPQCPACEKAQDQICMLIAQEQHAHDSTRKLQVQRSVTATDEDSTTCGTCCRCFARLKHALCKCIPHRCCRCCDDLDWYLCKCCVNIQKLCCKCCCHAEIGFLECYYQFLLASAKLCSKAPCFACLLFAVLELFIICATFRLPTHLQRMIGSEGYVWGFIFVIFIVCCLLPCCALCAPFAIVVQEVKNSQKKMYRLESSIDGLADMGAGLEERLGTLQDMFTRSFGNMGKMVDNVNHAPCLTRGKK